MKPSGLKCSPDKNNKEKAIHDQHKIEVYTPQVLWYFSYTRLPFEASFLSVREKVNKHINNRNATYVSGSNPDQNPGVSVLFNKHICDYFLQQQFFFFF